MRYLCLFVTLLLFSSNSYAQRYLSLSYGVADSNSDARYLDDVDGNVIALSYGKNTSQSFAWEATLRKTSFDETTDTIVFPGFGEFDIATEMDVLSLGGGFRYFFARFINVNAGLLYSKADLNIKTDIGGGAIAEDDSGLGIYYGAGIQLPLGPIELIADYTFHKFASDVTATEITGGVRLRF